jgi:ankyrin repeat protein
MSTGKVKVLPQHLSECLSLLINHGAQLDKADNEGATPTNIACQNGLTECLSLLINHGAQLDKADNEGITPAFKACQNGHTDCLSLLVKDGVGSKTLDDESGPIHIACQEGHFECVKTLLDHGKVDVNCTNKKKTDTGVHLLHHGPREDPAPPHPTRSRLEPSRYYARQISGACEDVRYDSQSKR